MVSRQTKDRLNASLSSLLYVAILLGAVFLGRSMTQAFESRVENLRTEVVQGLETQTSQSLSWEAISPSIVQGVTVYGVSISDNATAASVTVRLNLISLLWGNPRDLIPTVIVQEPSIRLQTPEQRQRLQDTIAFVQANARGRRDLTIEVRRGEIFAAEGNDNATIDGLNGSVSLEGAGLAGRISTRLTARTEVMGEPFTVSSLLTVELNGERGSPDLEANVGFEDIQGSHLVMDDQSFRIERRSDEISLERIQSDDPLDLSVIFNVPQRLVTMELISQNYSPDATLQLRGPWAELSPWLATRISSDAVVRIDLDQGFLDSTGTLTASSAHPDLPGPLTLSGRYSVDDRELRFPDLTITSGTGTLDFTGGYRFGDVAPSGTLRARDFAYGPVPRTSGELQLIGSAQQARLASRELAVAGNPLFEIEAHYRPGDRYHSAELTGFFEPNRNSQVTVRGRFASLEDLRGEVRLRQVALAPAGELLSTLVPDFSLPAAVSSVRASGVVRLDRRDGSTSIEVPSVTLRDDANPQRFASITGRYQDRTAVVDQLFLSLGGTRITADGLVHVGTGGTLDFDTVISIDSIPYPLRGTATPDSGLVVYGPDGVDLRITRSDQGAYVLNARFSDVAIPLGAARMNASMEGLFFAPGDWYLTVSSLRLDGLPAPGGGTSSLELALSFRPEEGQIALLRYADGAGDLAGTLDLSYRTSTTPELQVNGRIGSFEGNEGYRISARYADGQAALDLRFSESPMRRVSPRVRSGTASGTVQLAGPIGAPQVRVAVETTSVQINQQEMRLRLLAYGDENELRLTNTRVAVGTAAFEIGQLRLDRVSGSLQGDAELLRPELGRRYNLSLEGSTGPLPRLDLNQLRSQPLTAELQVSIPEADQRSQTEVPFVTGAYRFERIEGLTRLERDDRAIAATLDDQGAFDLRLQTPLPVSLTATGQVRQDQIELTVSGIRADLSMIDRVIGNDSVSIEAGEARGSLRILGAPSDPDIFGTLALRDLVVGTPLGPDPVGPFRSTVVFQEKVARLPETQTPFGDAQVTLDGRAVFNRLTMEQYEVNVTIAGDPGVRVDSTFGPVEVDGYAKGRLTIGGTGRETRLSGHVQATSTQISLSEGTERNRDDRRRGFLLDLTVRTNRGVQFIWPDRDFPILRSNFATGQSVEISSDSQESEFSMTGTVDIQSGDVFYFDRSFLIRDGEIRFDEDEDEFDPRLSARAELREVTPEGPVEIYLVAERQRLSEFSPRFSSNPPLSGDEIVAILGGNIFEQGTGDTVNLSTALLSTSDVVTQFGVFRQFEESVREQLDLDLFAIRTSVIQNVLLSAIEPTDAAVQPASPTLGTFFDDTSIFMGRYIGDSVFGQVVIQLRSRDMEGEIEEDPGIQRLGGVLIDSEISLEWQTPFFQLEWNFAPQNPEELFIRDNTFTFSWSFSY